MRRLLPLLILLSFFTPLEARAKPRFGLGFFLGEPSGISGKYWLSESRGRRNEAIDFGLAYSFGDFFLVFASYHFIFSNTWGGDKFVRELHPYVGVGGILRVATGNDDTDFGVRVPLGIEWRPSKDPFGVFVEIAPTMQIIPSTQGSFQGLIGARYYF